MIIGIAIRIILKIFAISINKKNYFSIANDERSNKNFSEKSDDCELWRKDEGYDLPNDGKGNGGHSNPLKKPAIISCDLSHFMLISLKINAILRSLTVNYQRS